jgi:hypothetical protein
MDINRGASPAGPSSFSDNELPSGRMFGYFSRKARYTAISALPAILKSASGLGAKSVVRIDTVDSAVSVAEKGDILQSRRAKKK